MSTIFLQSVRFSTRQSGTIHVYDLKRPHIALAKLIDFNVREKQSLNQPKVHMEIAFGLLFCFTSKLLSI